MDFKSYNKNVLLDDNTGFLSSVFNAEGAHFLHDRGLQKIFIAMLLCCISPFIKAETSDHSKLRENLFSPDKRVACNAQIGVCYDRMGPSIGLTQIYLGNEAAQRLTDVMREQVMLSGPGKVFFPTQDSVCIGETGPCIANGSIDDALTGILYGPWRESDQNAQKLALLNVEWQWVGSRYNDDTSIMPPEPSRYTVIFLTDGLVRARVDCNRAGGRYDIDAHQLKIDITRSTRVACEPNSMETAFLKDIARTNSFFLKQGRLYIDLNYHSGTMEFKQ